MMRLALILHVDEGRASYPRDGGTAPPLSVFATGP